MRNVKFCYLIYFFWVSVMTSFAVTRNDVKLKMIDNINISNGLSHNGVTTVFKDSRGYFWFGTYDGLNLYNGFSTTIYKNTVNSKILISNRIRCIQEDNKKRLWLGTDDGITVFDYNRESFYNLNKNNISTNAYDYIIKSLFFLSKSNEMICVTQNNGIIIYDQNSNLIRQDLSEKNVTNNKGIKLNDKYILLATTKGIRLYSIENGQTINILPHITSSIQDICKINDSLMAICFDTYISIIKIKNYENFEVEHTYNYNKSIQTITKDSNNNIWIGFTYDGFACVKYLDENIKNHKYLKNNRIASFYPINNSDVWVATFDNGLFKYTVKDVFKSINSINMKMPHIFHIDSTRIFLQNANSNSYIYYISSMKEEMMTRDNSLKSYKLLKDSENSFDIIFSENQPFIEIRTGKEILKKKSNKLLLLKKEKPLNYLFDRYGNIWLGYSDNLYRISFDDNNNIKDVESIHQNTYFREKGISKIRSIYEDYKTGTIMIGTNTQGLYIVHKYKDTPLKDVSISQYTNNENDLTSLSSNFVSSILRTPDGVLWIGTEQGGLCKGIETSGNLSFKVYSEKDGLSNNVVKGLLCDDNGGLWISTNIGLNYYNKKTDSFHVYRKKDGLPFEDFWYSTYKDKGGKLWFSGINDICYFEPKELSYQEELPKIHFRSLKIYNHNIYPNQKFGGRILLNKKLTDGDLLKLNYNENSFSISIDALYNESATDHYIKYKLIPTGTDWIHIPASEQKISFNNLQPGDYKLYVSASNSFGEWTENKVLNISIKPPFWKSNYAYAVYILLGLLSILIVIYIIIHIQNLKHNLHIEAIEKQNLQTLNIEKQRYFSNISHELKTPLTLILAPLSMLNDRFTLDLEVKNKLSSIKRQVKKMLQLIEMFHELQLNENNLLRIRPSNFSFNQLVDDITEDFIIMAQHDNKKLSVESPSENIQVLADYAMIETILNNLLNNAIKYTKSEDCIIIKYSCHENLLVLTVEDTGFGIAESDLPHIFEQFYQAPRKNNLNIGGTGIGLAFTKRLVELHSGTISVYSKIDVGTTFTISMPIVQSVLQEDNSNKIVNNSINVKEWDIKSIKLENNITNSKVFLVEDNSEMRIFLKDILENFFNIKSFSNGKECLDAMQTEWPDIIISDVMMPEMDGNELCHKIKEDLKTSHIPIILLTACDTIDDKIKGLKSGADAYISKPFYPNHLITRIETLLYSRQQLKERFKTNIPLTLNKENGLSIKDNEFIQELYVLFSNSMDNEDIDIDLFARHLGVNRTLFFQKVKALTGETPYELFKDYRLQKAAELLLEGESNVTEICTITGFKSRTHFSRLFKDKYKVSPSKYKDYMNKSI